MADRPTEDQGAVELEARLRAGLRHQAALVHAATLDGPGDVHDRAVRRRRTRRLQAMCGAAAVVVALAVAVPLAVVLPGAPHDRHGGALALPVTPLSNGPTSGSSGGSGTPPSGPASLVPKVTAGSTPATGSGTASLVPGSPACRIGKQVITCGRITSGGTATTGSVTVSVGHTISVTLPRPSSGGAWGRPVVSGWAGSSSGPAVITRGSLRPARGSRHFTIVGRHAGAARIVVRSSACSDNGTCSAHAGGATTWALSVTVVR